MKISGQIYARSALPPEMPQYPLSEIWVGPRAILDLLDQRNSPALTRIRQPGNPTSSSVTVMTMLSRFLLLISANYLNL